MNQSSENDIIINGLRMSFGNLVVLNDIDLSISNGEVTSILGPSGCGKTTLLKCMLGVVRPQKGNIWMLGKDILRTEREELSKFLTNVGVTFQHGALFGSRNIAENVAVPLREHTDMNEDAIQQLVRIKLAMVDMESALYKMPSELSGGMQKRAAIARSLALDPPILFLDEPAAGLDPVTAHQLDELIIFINRTLGATIVVVTHEIQSAMRISDNIVFLSDGEIQQTGTVEDFKNSVNPAVVRFLECYGSNDFKTCRELREQNDYSQ